jgi:hypothetical protein
MAHPIEHARNSARSSAATSRTTSRSTVWFDESKAFFADFRRRALRHHPEGIFLAERIFGVTVFNLDGVGVPAAISENNP